MFNVSCNLETILHIQTVHTNFEISHQLLRLHILEHMACANTMLHAFM